MLLVDYLDKLGSDLTVVNAARVSFDKQHDEFKDPEDMRLLRFLAREGHVSPFFHPQISVRVTAPIFVARQLLRSTVGLAVSEISRRYISSKPQFYCPKRWRARPDGSIKQGSGEELPEEEQQALHELYAAICIHAERDYECLLEMGVAPEMARMVLPQSMVTQWIWTGSLSAFHRVYKLRIDGHAQEESQVIAEQIGEICSQHFPYSWQALNDG
jgi:thymidylate synthase (FAD)